MSAPRRMLSALWAAVWLRGRLLGLSLRRLFGGGPKTAAAGPDFQLLGAGVAAEEAAHEPIELPAEMLARLEATRGDLLRSARAASARRHARPRGGARRLRAASIAVAALLGLGVVGAGASALVAGSTGVPAVDRLLGIYETNLDKPGAADRPGPSGSDLQPSPTKASEPIEATLGDGARNVTSFYVARNGKICWSVADLDGSGSGMSSCDLPRAISEELRIDDGYVPGIEIGTTYVILRGYVSSNIEGLSGHGPNGPLDIHLGEVWSPASSYVGPLKPFVAVGAVGGDLDASERQRAFELQNYAFEGLTDGGRKIRILP